MRKLSEKQQFFLKNLARGLIWFLIILVFFVTIRKTVDHEKLSWLDPIANKPILIYSVFSLSELLFGILPPEIFMIWALQKGSILLYIQIVALLFIISYGAGTIGYFAGKYINNSIFFRWIRIRFLGKHLDRLQKYGMYLLIVAAVTPLPFSGICMLVGASKYPINKFFIYSSTRILRFSVYGWIMYEASLI